jgi:TatD DNase family protein
MVTISTRVGQFNELRALVEGHDHVFCSIGTHPHNAAEEPDITVEELVDISMHEKVVAIGEAGLDYHYDHSPRDVQKKSFRTHIAAARETGLPLIIHARDAGADIARMLEEETKKGAFPFVLHCFTGGAGLAHRGLALGGYISFSGVVTFKNAEALRDIALAVPSDRLLVETDAPYLAPEPLRGKTNEPAFVVYTAARLAALRGLREAEMARLTTDNFFKLFKKVPRSALKAPQSAA